MADPKEILDDIRKKTEDKDSHILINALESVLGRHSKREKPVVDIFGNPIFWDDCTECKADWPCRTVKDIISELERRHV